MGLFAAAVIAGGTFLGSPSLPAHPAAPPPTPVSLRAVEGGFRWEGRRIAAFVRTDGSVRFFRWHSDQMFPDLLIALPLPARLPPGTPSLETSIRAWLHRPSTPPPPRSDPATMSTLADACARLKQGNCAASESTAMLFFPLGFDVLDHLAGLEATDPDRAEKERFLAQTAELRSVLAAQSRARDLRDSLAALPARLEEIWRDPLLTKPERRRTLYLLWAEADAKTVHGRQARSAIERFIRERLPATSTDAFRPGEEAAWGSAPDDAQWAPYARP